MTRLYAEVIGDPIAHSKSPLIHGFWLEKLDIPADYRACHVTPDALPAYFESRGRDLNWRGCNITIPHKIAALAHVETRMPIAVTVGAINTVYRHWDGTLAGTNTDVSGFASPLTERHFASALVIGAGGAARAVLAALEARPSTSVTVLNRNIEKATALIEEFGLKGVALPLDAPPPPSDLIVNASSLGMAGQPPLPDLSAAMRREGLVYDLVYAPLETPLLRTARERGIERIDGLSMLIGQAANAFAHFFGAEAPRAFDDELRTLLTA